MNPKIGDYYFCKGESRYIEIIGKTIKGFRVLNLASGRETNVMARTLEKHFKPAKPAGVIALKKDLDKVKLAKEKRKLERKRAKRK